MWRIPDEASVIHDWLYSTHSLDRRVADSIFYQALIFNGVGRFQAILMWLSVRLFGANGSCMRNQSKDEDRSDLLALLEKLAADAQPRTPEAWAISVAGLPILRVAQSLPGSPPPERKYEQPKRRIRLQ
jgi:hypothetical protein